MRVERATTPCLDAETIAAFAEGRVNRRRIREVVAHLDVCEGCRDAVEAALDLLDQGKARVAEKLPGATGPNSWKVNQWLKKAVLLSFRLNDNAIIEGGPGQATWWDKVPSKFDSWGKNRFKDAGFRAVPGAIVRRSAFIARRSVTEISAATSLSRSAVSASAKAPSPRPRLRINARCTTRSA